MFERTYDGTTWEEVSTQTVKERLAGYYRCITDLLREMRKNPGMEVRTPFAVYRYRKA